MSACAAMLLEALPVVLCILLLPYEVYHAMHHGLAYTELTQACPHDAKDVTKFYDVSKLPRVGFLLTLNLKVILASLFYNCSGNVFNCQLVHFKCVRDREWTLLGPAEVGHRGSRAKMKPQVIDK